MHPYRWHLTVSRNLLIWFLERGSLVTTLQSTFDSNARQYMYTSHWMARMACMIMWLISNCLLYRQTTATWCLVAAINFEKKYIFLHPFITQQMFYWSYNIKEGNSLYWETRGFRCKFWYWLLMYYYNSHVVQHEVLPGISKVLSPY